MTKLEAAGIAKGYAYGILLVFGWFVLCGLINMAIHFI